MFNKELFAKRFKELREKTNLNQRDCAEKLGISRGSISFYENGDRLPDIETIYNMADFFNVSADYLIGISDTPSKDVNIKSICDYTGLSEKSIDVLRQIKNPGNLIEYFKTERKEENTLSSIIAENNRNLANFIIENVDFWELIIQTAKYTSAHLKQNVFYHIDTTDFDVQLANGFNDYERLTKYTDLNDIKKLALFNCQQAIINIIKENGTTVLLKYRKLNEE